MVPEILGETVHQRWRSPYFDQGIRYPPHQTALIVGSAAPRSQQPASDKQCQKQLSAQGSPERNEHSLSLASRASGRRTAAPDPAPTQVRVASIGGAIIVNTLDTMLALLKRETSEVDRRRTPATLFGAIPVIRAPSWEAPAQNDTKLMPRLTAARLEPHAPAP
jgi:hypothetical protein